MPGGGMHHHGASRQRTRAADLGGALRCGTGEVVSDAPMSTLIQNGTVINADGKQRADVLFEGETITRVAPNIPAAGHTVVDATGLLVMPGGVDVHTHLDMPFGGTVSADDYRTGTIAAAVGGTTTVIDFALKSMGTPMGEALEMWLAKSAGKACIDYGLHMAVTDLGPGDGARGMAGKAGGSIFCWDA